MVQEKTSAAKYHCDTPVTVSSFVFVIDSGNFCFFLSIFVCLLHAFQVVVKGRTRQLSDFKKEGQSIFWP